METARTKIRELLGRAACPAVLCSFGKDSLLVLALAREVVPTIPVIWFRPGTDESFPKATMRDWGVVGLSPAPADVYLLVGPNDKPALVHEYDFGGTRLPLITDLEPGRRCSLTAYPRRTPTLFHPWDVLLVGWKDTDSHWLKSTTPFRKDGFMLGHAEVHAPIRHMTDSQVREAIYTLGLPTSTVPDSLPLCTHCMTANATEVFCPEVGHIIPRVQWEQDQALTAFQRRFNLEETRNG